MYLGDTDLTFMLLESQKEKRKRMMLKKIEKIKG